MSLSEDKKGEIALALLRYTLSQEGFVPERINQEMDTIAAATGFDRETLIEFWREVVHEVVEGSFTGLEGLTEGTKGWINPVP